MSSSSVKLFVGFQRRSSIFLLQSILPIRCTLRNTNSCKQTFKYDDLLVSLIPDYSVNRKPDFGDLKFGTIYSYHMLKVEWTEKNGWGRPIIEPLNSFTIHPGAKVLHYAQAVFEGMKAFRHFNGKVALFRPELNMERLLFSSQRACLPSFDCDELLKCIKKLVSIDKNWVPSRELSSLYIRPNFIGTEKTLGVASSKEALLYVITSPTGPYFQSTIEPISLLADPKYVRAPPGGVGCFKMASNYAPTLYIQKLAQDQHLNQVLWLLGPDYQITEAGAMNVFFVLQNNLGKLELVTPPLDGTILPGVVRQSVLDLAREWNEFLVSERSITMTEVISAQKENRLLEMFVCGTAASVCPVKLVQFMGENIEIPTSKEQNPLHIRFLKNILDIQYGKTKSKWSVPV